MTITVNRRLSEDERINVEGSAHYVLEPLPQNLTRAYEMFENFASDHCDLYAHEEECEEIFDKTAIYYGLN